MKPTIVDNKELAMQGSVESPTYVVTSAASSGNKKGSVTKKHVLYVVSGVAVVALLLVAILVGMHMFSQSQKDIVKFTLQFKGSNNEDVKQDVESDPNHNVVLYHVTKAGQDAYVVDDFNKGMQIVKMDTDEGVNCYVTALNKSSSLNPGQITGAESMNSNISESGKNADQYVVAEDPVLDRSFLPKKAQELCRGVAVYWVTKHCGQEITGLNNTDSEVGRSKRWIRRLAPYHGLPGLAACCWYHYACSVILLEYSYGCRVYATRGTCCGTVARPFCQTYYTGYNRAYC